METQERKSAKTIGLSLSTWKKLKMYALERDSGSLSDAVEEMLELTRLDAARRTSLDAEKKSQ
jgi:macrodomain Ter protein organizer (MatP/YcbG family)